MSEYIYVKDSVLKQFPKSIIHPVAPLLYIENGTMPSSKSKPKPCVIAVNLAGVYFCRPKLFGSSYKVGLFVSIFAIKEIEYVDATTRNIYADNHKYYFVCDHPDIAVMNILACRSRLFQNSLDLNPIRLLSFPIPPKNADNYLAPLASPSMCRFYCLSCMYDCSAPDSLMDMFKEIDNNMSPNVVIGQNCDVPSNIKSLVMPFEQLHHINHVTFRNFSPSIVFLVTRSFMKQSKTISMFSFDGYKSFSPSQMRMKDLEPKTWSFLFVNCEFDDQSIDSLFNEFADFRGNIQRLSFVKTKISTQQLERVLSYLPKCRSCLSIEYLEFNGILLNGPSQKGLSDLFIDVTKSCRFLHSLLLLNWSHPSLFSPVFLNNHWCLKTLCINGQDLSHQIPDEFVFGKQLQQLDVSQCQFSFQSLKSLFECVSKIEGKITLNMRELVLPSSHWVSFFECLSSIPSSKCIVEFDWSCNPIPESSLELFCHFIFDLNPIKFLCIDNIFAPNTLESLKMILEFASTKDIWGLSLKGSSLKNFGQAMIRNLLPLIEKFVSLSYLDLSQQFITDNSIQYITTFLGKKKSLRQFICDNTSLSSAERFLFFYNTVLMQKHLKAIGRPHNDIERLRITSNEGYLGFSESLSKLFVPVSRIRRSYYYNISDIAQGHSPDDFLNGCNVLPICYSEYESLSAQYYLSHNSYKPLPTLLSSQQKDWSTSLEQIQFRQLKSVYLQPQYENSSTFEIPKVFSNIIDQSGPIFNQNSRIMNASSIQLENLSECQEIQDVITMLSSLVDIEDINLTSSLYDFQIKAPPPLVSGSMNINSPSIISSDHQKLQRTLESVKDISSKISPQPVNSEKLVPILNDSKSDPFEKRKDSDNVIIDTKKDSPQIRKPIQVENKNVLSNEIKKDTESNVVSQKPVLSNIRINNEPTPPKIEGNTLKNETESIDNTETKGIITNNNDLVSQNLAKHISTVLPLNNPDIKPKINEKPNPVNSLEKKTPTEVVMHIPNDTQEIKSPIKPPSLTPPPSIPTPSINPFKGTSSLLKPTSMPDVITKRPDIPAPQIPTPLGSTFTKSPLVSSIPISIPSKQNTDIQLSLPSTIPSLIPTPPKPTTITQLKPSFPKIHEIPNSFQPNLPTINPSHIDVKQNRPELKPLVLIAPTSIFEKTKNIEINHCEKVPEIIHQALHITSKPEIVPLLIIKPSPMPMINELQIMKVSGIEISPIEIAQQNTPEATLVFPKVSQVLIPSEPSVSSPQIPEISFSAILLGKLVQKTIYSIDLLGVPNEW